MNILRRSAGKVVCGDVREVLRQFPDEYFHVLVTSPPYWGLRDYDIEPSVWEHPDTLSYRRETGDTSVLCEHEWGDRLPDPHPSGLSIGGCLGADKEGGGRDSAQGKTAGQFCSLCGCWRGCLGLEPDPSMFTDHIVEIFRAIRPKMRKDSVIWVNMGSSFVSQTMESEEMILRDDLTDKDREYVFRELAKHFAEASKAVS